MKTFSLYIFVFALSCLFYACSGSQYISRYQEYDDIYFTRADRTESERFASNASTYLSSGYGQSKQSQQRSYKDAYQSSTNPTSSANRNARLNPNSNPDYYQQEVPYNDSTNAIVEYYKDNYIGFNNQNPTSSTFQGDHWHYQQPRHGMHMGMSPWGNHFGWHMGMPLSNNLWMGFGSGWGNGFYDPWGWNSPWAWNAWNRPWRGGWNAWNQPFWGGGWNAWNQPFWGVERVRTIVYRPRGSSVSSGSNLLNNPQSNTSYNIQNARRQRTYAISNRNGQSGSSSAISNSGRTRNRTSNSYTLGGNATYNTTRSNSSSASQQRRSNVGGMFYNNNQNNNRQSSRYQHNSSNNGSSFGNSGGRSRTSSSSGSFRSGGASSSGSSIRSSSGGSGRSSGSSGGRSGVGRSRP